MSTSEQTAADLEPRRGSASPRLEEKGVQTALSEPVPGPRLRSPSNRTDKACGRGMGCLCEFTQKPKDTAAGPEFSDPTHELVDWLAARYTIKSAQARYDNPDGPMRFLLINGSSRSEHTCPGELSKSYCMVEIAKAVLEQNSHTKVEILDLSRLSSKYGREIHPCKACFSTSAALCH